MEEIRAGAVQFEHIPGKKEANLEKVEAFAEEAKEQGLDLIVFPECCLTGYWFLRHLDRPALESLAEPVPDGPSARRLSELAVGLGLVIGAGLVEKDGRGRFFNTYIVAEPDGEVHSHRKLHAFVHPLIESGESFTVFDSRCGARLAVLTCYDNNIVENVRAVALRGADVLLAPHQTGGCRSTNPHTMGIVERSKWDRREVEPELIEEEFRGPKGRGWLLRWLPSRAHDNGLFLIFSNGVGIDDDEVRTGNSMILDPYGRILAETWKARDEMVTATLDPSLPGQSTGRRWIRTRRPELYAPLAEKTGEEADTRLVRFDEKGV